MHGYNKYDKLKLIYWSDLSTQELGSLGLYQIKILPNPLISISYGSSCNLWPLTNYFEINWPSQNDQVKNEMV